MNDYLVFMVYLCFRQIMFDDVDLRHHVFELPPEEEEVAKLLANNSVYVGKKLTTDARVPGRIGKPEYFSFWRDELKASDFILNTIRYGYKFPFDSVPPESMCKNNKSFMQNREFGYKELLKEACKKYHA